MLKRRARNQRTGWIPGILALSLGFLTGLAGCESDDIGEPCGTDAAQLPGDTVAGEDPVLEIVRFERDGTCESFQCLRHLGIAPYCTRNCELDGRDDTACTVDADCPRPLFCEDGFCQDDDCPKGFWCRSVQDVGPVADQRFCVKRSGCQDALDCEDPGGVECVNKGCFDACVRDGVDCQFNALVCDPLIDLPCACQGGAENCADDQLICQPDGQAAWPVGAVVQTGICEKR